MACLIHYYGKFNGLANSPWVLHVILVNENVSSPISLGLGAHNESIPFAIAETLQRSNIERQF
jgi:hypothetical protein